MPSIGGMQSKVSLNEDGVVSFNSKGNANSFCRFSSNLADSLLQKLPPPKYKFNKILKNLDVPKASGIDQI